MRWAPLVRVVIFASLMTPSFWMAGGTPTPNGDPPTSTTKPSTKPSTTNATPNPNPHGTPRDSVSTHFRIDPVGDPPTASDRFDLTIAGLNELLPDLG